MTTTHTTGLGYPEPIGKGALFRPPVEKLPAKKAAQPKPQSTTSRPPKRVRTTIDLTRQALTIIQQIQHRHRLATGKVLPLWKAVSQAIEAYGREKGVGER